MEQLATERQHLTVAGCTLLDVGIEVGRPLQDSELEEVCGTICFFDTAAKWWAIDILALCDATGRSHIGEKFHWNADTCLARQRLGTRIPMDRRRHELTISHHIVVQSMSPGDQDHWLSEAVRLDLSVSALKKRIRDDRKAEVQEDSTASVDCCKYMRVADVSWKVDAEDNIKLKKGTGWFLSFGQDQFELTYCPWCGAALI